MLTVTSDQRKPVVPTVHTNTRSLCFLGEFLQRLPLSQLPRLHSKHISGGQSDRVREKAVKVLPAMSDEG